MDTLFASGHCTARNRDFRYAMLHKVTGPPVRYTNIHAIMSGKQNKYPLGKKAGVVGNRSRQGYVLQVNNQHTAVSANTNSYRQSRTSVFSCRAQERNLRPKHYMLICLEVFVVAQFHKIFSAWQVFIHNHKSDTCFCCRRMCPGWPISFPTLSATF
jgi:hypothetical protein